MPVIKLLKAFTILELIVVMILTAIVSGIIYLVLSIFLFQYSSFGKTAAYMLDYYACKQRMEKDISTCSLLEKAEDSLICVKGNARIAYHFKENRYIIRSDNGTNADTFHLRYETPGWQVKPMRTLKAQLVDFFGVVVYNGEEKYPWQFIKHYDEAALFNFDTDN